MGIGYARRLQANPLAQALYVNGADDYVSLEQPLWLRNFPGTGGYTLEVQAAMPSPPVSGYLLYAGAHNNKTAGFSLIMSATTYRWLLHDGANYYDSGNKAMNYDAACTLTLTLDKTLNRIRVFKDGAYVSNHAPLAATVTGETPFLHFGGVVTTSNVEATVHYFRAWQAKLSDAEVLAGAGLKVSFIKPNYYVRVYSGLFGDGTSFNSLPTGGQIVLTS